MLLLITGVFLLLLGLFSGVVLVAGPLGLAAWTPGLVLWVLFPAFSVAGYVLFATGARMGQVRAGSLLLSALLLLLALASAAGIVLQAASVLPPQGGTASLWYVMVVAGLIGIVGAASVSRLPAEPAGQT